MKTGDITCQHWIQNLPEIPAFVVKMPHVDQGQGHC